MSLLKRMLPIVVCMVPLFGMAAGFSGSDTKDTEFLQDWLDSKRAISVRDLGGELSISGEGIVGYQWNKDKPADSNEGYIFYEHHSTFPWQAKLNIDYKGFKSWTSFSSAVNKNFSTFQKDFSNSISRALMGFMIFEDGNASAKLEVGRRKAYEIFSSEIQFNSVLEGAMLNVGYDLESAGALSATGAVSIQDIETQHLAFIGALGYTNIADFGVDLHYNFSYWKKPHESDLTVILNYDRTNSQNKIVKGLLKDNPQHRFAISEIYLNYGIDLAKDTAVVTLPGVKGSKTSTLPARVFGSFSINHAAKESIVWFQQEAVVTDNTVPNAPVVTTTSSVANFSVLGGEYAYVLGLELGQLESEGDWLIRAAYESVGAQSIPERDIAGISTGDHDGSIYSLAENNVMLTKGFTETYVATAVVDDVKKTSTVTTYRLPRPKSNYYGGSLTLGYAMTNNIVLQGAIAYSKTKDIYYGHQATDTTILGASSGITYGDLFRAAQYTNITFRMTYAF